LPLEEGLEKSSADASLCAAFMRGRPVLMLHESPAGPILAILPHPVRVGCRRTPHTQPPPLTDLTVILIVLASSLATWGFLGLCARLAPPGGPSRETKP
jgi:hypothetical protein